MNNTSPKYKIAFIKENNEIKSDNSFIEFKEVSNEILLEEFIKYVDMNNDDLSDTMIIHHDPEVIYQICYITDCKKQSNLFSSLLTLDETVINGKTMIIATKFPINSTNMYNIDVTLEDLNRILNNRKEFIGIKINKDGLDEITICKEKDFSEFKKLELCLYRFNLDVYYKDNSEDYENKIASNLFGQRLYGDVIVISKLTQEVCDNLSKIDIEKIIKLSENDIKLTKDDIDWGENIVVTKYRLLQKKYQDIL